MKGSEWDVKHQPKQINCKFKQIMIFFWLIITGAKTEQHIARFAKCYALNDNNKANSLSIEHLIT